MRNFCPTWQQHFAHYTRYYNTTASGSGPQNVTVHFSKPRMFSPLPKYWCTMMSHNPWSWLSMHPRMMLESISPTFLPIVQSGLLPSYLDHWCPVKGTIHNWRRELWPGFSEVRIPHIPFWMALHLGHWPYAFVVHFGSKEGNSFTGCRVLSTLDPSLSISLWCAVHPSSCKCGWTVVNSSAEECRAWVFIRAIHIQHQSDWSFARDSVRRPEGHCNWPDSQQVIPIYVRTRRGWPSQLSNALKLYSVKAEWANKWRWMHDLGNACHHPKVFTKCDAEGAPSWPFRYLKNESPCMHSCLVA